MKSDKIGLIASILLVISLHSVGQKIKYRDNKELSTKNYRTTIVKEKYSPLLAGACNYLLPSSGYFYVGEPLRGIAVLGSQIVASSVITTGLYMVMSVNPESEEAIKGGRAVMISGVIASGLIHIWSTFDVVKIAKIKNLVYQEHTIAINVKPDVFLLSHSEKNSAIYGLKLTLNF